MANREFDVVKGAATAALRVPPMLPVLRVPPMFPAVRNPPMLPADAVEETMSVRATARMVGRSIFIFFLLVNGAVYWGRLVWRELLV